MKNKKITIDLKTIYKGFNESYKFIKEHAEFDTEDAEFWLNLYKDYEKRISEMNDDFSKSLLSYSYAELIKIAMKGL